MKKKKSKNAKSQSSSQPINAKIYSQSHQHETCQRTEHVTYADHSKDITQTQKTKPNLLSICIHTYKRAKILRETLEHLTGILNFDFELVIADNNSQDGTREVVEEFKDRFGSLKYYCQTENRGAKINSQTGTGLATGKYTYILCDDDRVIPEGMVRAIETMEADESIVAVYCGYQEWNLTTGAIANCPNTDKKTIYTAADKIKMLTNHSLLWLPLVRTDTYQRFCFSDENAHGLWGLVSQLLRQGNIAVLPELIYRHAHTEPRAEYDLTEPWYHEKHRSDFELFLASINQEVTPEIKQAVVNFVCERSTPTYLQGYRFAKIKNQYMTQRHYLLKASAYGHVNRNDLAQWENANILHLVCEKIRDRLPILGNVRMLVFEKSLVGSRVMALMNSLYDNIPPCMELETTEFIERKINEEEYYISEHHETLKRRKDIHKSFHPKQTAIYDLICSLQVTNRRIEFHG